MEFDLISGGMGRVSRDWRYGAGLADLVTLGGRYVTTPVDLAPFIAATTQWLLRAYPAMGGTYRATLAEVQARQAVTVATWLRYPTAMDAALLELVGAGGSARLDDIVESDIDGDEVPAWRSWVDEVVASWAACLLSDPELAVAAVAALANSEHAAGADCEFQRLTAPDDQDTRPAVLLRHPDLVAPIADLHRGQLFELLYRSAIS
jgi:hypothetical protein